MAIKSTSSTTFSLVWQRASFYAPRCMFMIQFLQINRSFELIRSNLHLRESQWVVVAFPVDPLYTVSVRLVRASQVTTVQVGLVTSLVPPGTTVPHGTRHTVHIRDVLVISAELLSYMVREWITFNHRQQTSQQYNLLDQLIFWSKLVFISRVWKRLCVDLDNICKTLYHRLLQCAK